MKRHIFSMATAAIVALAFIGCEDLVKDDIDADYNRDATISAPVVTDVTDASATVSYNAEFDTTNLAGVYCGVVLSTTEDFAEKIDVAIAPGQSKSVNVAGDTKYYAKSYIVTGVGVKYSDVTTFQTAKPKEFEDKYLFGTYSAYDDGDQSYIYDMEISWVEGTYNRINITNWWDGGKTVTASVDFEKKQILVDIDAVVAEDPDAGWIAFYAIGEDGDLTDELPIVGTYDANGNISFPLYGIYVEKIGTYSVSSSTEMAKQ